MLDDALTALRGKLTVAGLPAPEIGPAPNGDSIGMYIAGGTPSEYLSRGREDNLTLVINVKNLNQITAVQWGEKVTKTLCGRATALPAGTDWRVESISVSTPLTFVDIEETGRYIYSVIFDMIYSTKGA